MKLGNRCCRAAFATSLIIAVALISTARQAGAVERRFDSTPPTPISYLVLNNNGKPVGTSISPCNSKGDCADGIRFDWPAGRCFEQRRYAPIVTVWMYKHNPLPNYWPIVADCSDGITLYWNSKGVMTPATWQGAVDEHQDLYRFPKHSDGANIYFQGGESLMQAEWMKVGKVVSSDAIPGPADNVYWSSAPFKTTLPPSRRVTRPKLKRQILSQPAVELLGRDAEANDESIITAALAGANGIQFGWYLSLSQRGKPWRGCLLVGSTYWATPVVTFGFTNGPSLDSRLRAMKCATDSQGKPIHFNQLDFSWQPSTDGTKNVLSSVTGSFDGSPAPNNFPQPPPGTDGLDFGFDLDDYQQTFWTTDGAVVGSRLSSPGHTRLASWPG